jgi:hypothetical protein
MYSETPKLGRWRRLDKPTTAIVRLFFRMSLMDSPAERSGIRFAPLL